MLPNHAPLMVAERFKVLEALFPGRIDLGLGRAPGTDPVTSYALRRRQDIREDDDFLDRFQELLLLRDARLSGRPSVPQRARHADRRAAAADLPARLDGLSARSLPPRSARAFPSRIISPIFDAVDAMRIYRDKFRPSPSHAKPYAILATACGVRRHRRGSRAAGHDGRSEFRAPRQGRVSAARLARGGGGLRLHAGRPARASRRTAARLSVGSPATVKARLGPLIEATQADEVMVTTMIYDHEARKHSYELLARAFA